MPCHVLSHNPQSLLAESLWPHEPQALGPWPLALDRSPKPQGVTPKPRATSSGQRAAGSGQFAARWYNPPCSDGCVADFDAPGPPCMNNSKKSKHIDNGALTTNTTTTIIMRATMMQATTVAVMTVCGRRKRIFGKENMGRNMRNIRAQVMALPPHLGCSAGQSGVEAKPQTVRAVGLPVCLVQIMDNATARSHKICSRPHARFPIKPARKEKNKQNKF